MSFVNVSTGSSHPPTPLPSMYPASDGFPNTAPVGENQGKQVETVGPDGVKRKVRIVGPTL